MADLPHLVVLHSHLRPGGVRRVIEIALPAIVREMKVCAVTLGTGEAAPAAWIEGLAAKMPGVALHEHVVREFRYTSEQRLAPDRLRRRVTTGARRLLADADALWFHNPSLARNVPLVEAVNREVASRSVRAVYHHHDLWVDHRWTRWAELRGFGFRTLDAVARVVFPPHVFHATINRLDEGVIEAESDFRSAWMPNPVERNRGPKNGAVVRARRWFRKTLGDGGPVWMFPTRFLRRKNLAEAVLLTRWLRPDAHFVSTAAISSPEEAAYAARLEEVSKRRKWRAKFGILAAAGPDAPEVSALVGAAEMLVLTSVQEGFGLPWIEAAAMSKPVVARALPNVAPDLRGLGFRFPHLYDEVWVGREMFDEVAERRRQERVWRTWRRTLPGSVRRFAERPCLLEESEGPVAFSRLTLDAQLEVLAFSDGWERCRRWNPVLRKFQAGGARTADWPARAERLLSPERYAVAMREAFETEPAGSARNSAEIQRAFVEQRLGSAFLFPILIA